MGMIRNLKALFERTLSIGSKKNKDVQPAPLVQKDENEKRVQEDVDKLRSRIEARAEEKRREKQNEENKLNKVVTNKSLEEFEYKIIKRDNFFKPEDDEQERLDESSRSKSKNNFHDVKNSKNDTFGFASLNNGSAIDKNDESENTHDSNETVNRKAKGDVKESTLEDIPIKEKRDDTKKRKKKSCFKERGPVPNSISKLKVGPYHDQRRLVNPITYCGGQVFEKTSQHSYEYFQQPISANVEINQSINSLSEPWAQCQLALTTIDQPDLNSVTVQRLVPDLKTQYDLNSSKVLPSFSEGLQNTSHFAVALPESDITNQVVNVLENLNDNEVSCLYECVDQALYVQEPNICSYIDFENMDIPFVSDPPKYAQRRASVSPEIYECDTETCGIDVLDPAFDSHSGVGLVDKDYCGASPVFECADGLIALNDGFTSSPNETSPNGELKFDQNAVEVIALEDPKTPELASTFGPINILTPPQSNETVLDNLSPATSHLQYSPRSDTDSCRLSLESPHHNGEDHDEGVAKKKPNMKYFKQCSQKLSEHYSSLPCCSESVSCVEFLEKKENLLSKEHRTKLTYTIHTELSLKQVVSLLYYQVIPKLGAHDEQRAESVQLNVDLAVLLMCGRRLLGSDEGRQMLLSEKCGLALVSRAACARNVWATRYLVWCVRRALPAGEAPVRGALWAPHSVSASIETEDTYKGDNLVTLLAQLGDAYAASLAAIVTREPHEIPLFDIEHKNVDGYTALHVACQLHRSNTRLRTTDTVHVLTAHAGASLTTKEAKVGNTAVHLAVDSPHADLDLLLTLFLAVKNNKQGITRKSLAYCPNNGGEKPITLARRKKGTATYPQHIINFLERCRH